MMSKSKPWVELYAVLVLAVGALALEPRINLTTLDHKILLMAIVVVTYSLLALWIKAHQYQLSR